MSAAVVDDDLVPEAVRNRPSGGEAAARYIRRLIFEGRLRPGERIPQDDVARALGVSRIPIREALVALEQQGWVAIEKNRGAFVTMIDERVVHDHYELYGLVYGFASRKALERADATLGDTLVRIARDFGRATTPEVANRLALMFNAAIVDASASPRVEVMLRSMSTLVPGNFHALVPAATTLQRPGFTAIARAVRRGDGARSAAEYEKMMRRVAREVVVLFRARGLFT